MSVTPEIGGRRLGMLSPSRLRNALIRQLAVKRAYPLIGASFRSVFRV